MRRIVAILGIALAFVACSEDGDSGATATTGSSSTTATTEVGATTTSFPGGLAEVSTPASDYRYLKAVRLGAHDGFDRIVFEFESGVPGYSVKYVSRPVTEDGSGKNVAISGGALLQVRMEAASGADLSSGFRQTYTGSTRIKGDGAVMGEAVRTGDFEAVLTWVVGVREERPFHVYASEGNKLVVDIAG